MMQTLGRDVAEAFGEGVVSATRLGEGLIHQTFRVDYAGGKSLVLQGINNKVFTSPKKLIDNYFVLHEHLSKKGKGEIIPPPVLTIRNKRFFEDVDKVYWRAVEFTPGRLLRHAENAENTFTAAHGYAHFTRLLESIDPSRLAVALPGFHDLSARYEQFEASIAKAQLFRLLRATHVISELRSQYHLVQLYTHIMNSPDFPVRLLHHDCKLSNLLFSNDLAQAQTVLDLDTVMPGKFFSDLGDMVRTMACTEDENSTQWELIDVDAAAYKAVLKGYSAGLDDTLTQAEKDNIDFAGQIMIYMQCLRFVTDFLNNDVYYQTTYPEQNLNRALNQLILLEKLQQRIGKDIEVNTAEL
jgi:Ser/Thr protein kinase RdoA (MazF antagonist)